MKTPEEMAEEYSSWVDTGSHAYRGGVYEGFLAGYQAAKDQLADAGKVMNSLDKPDAWVRQFCVFCNDWHDGNCPPNRGRNFVKWNTNSPRSAKWISVKERLPEFCKTIVAYGPRIYCVISQLMQDEEGYSYVGPYMSVHPDEVTHWCEVPELPELPEAPEEEG